MGMYKEVCYYMLFALAAYGWPMYLMRKPACGLCRLASSCPWGHAHAQTQAYCHGFCVFFKLVYFFILMGVRGLRAHRKWAFTRNIASSDLTHSYRHYQCLSKSHDAYFVYMPLCISTLNKVILTMYAFIVFSTIILHLTYVVWSPDVWWMAPAYPRVWLVRRTTVVVVTSWPSADTSWIGNSSRSTLSTLPAMMLWVCWRLADSETEVI